MKARLRQIRMRDLALFVVVAGIVAVVVVLVGREAGLGEEAGAQIDQTANEPKAADASLAATEDSASQQAAPEAAGEEQEQAPEHTLVISLEAPEYCEAQRSRGSFRSEIVHDDDGNTVYLANGNPKRRNVETGWGGVTEVKVSWMVTGGVAPYTLEIDGERRDAFGVYEGATGTASVTCALAFGETFISEHAGERSRSFNEEPTVDSGWKSVDATVTDADGSTAQATVDLYVIRTDPEILTRGETYRVYGGHLVTAPRSYDIGLASPPEIECAEDVQDQRECEPAFGLMVFADGHRGDWSKIIASLHLYVSDAVEESRWRKLNGGEWVRIDLLAIRDNLDSDTVLDALDEMVDSLNQPAQAK